MSTGVQDDCPECDGNGEIVVEADDDYTDDYYRVCPNCNGEGYVVEYE